MNGPKTELLPAAWKRSEVFAGVVVVHDNVDQIGVLPLAGLASLSEEIRSPDPVNPVSM